jgi:ferritin-like metal-binding protein YciE
MADKGLKELYIDELKDLYSAENQLVKALPKMAKAATSPDLRAGFEEHLEQTKVHVQRLETIFEQLGESPKGKNARGWKALLKRAQKPLKNTKSNYSMLR